MGRRRRSRREERAIVQAIAAGIRKGRREALEDAMETTARKLFADEAKAVTALLDRLTPEEAMEALPRLFEAEEERWRETFEPLLADVIRAQVGSGRTR